MDTNCKGCGQKFGLFKWREVCPPKVGCSRSFCSSCLDFSLYPQQQLDKATPSPCNLCKQCFVKLNQLDFKHTYQIIGEQKIGNVLFVHGGSSCRIMFRTHAKLLAQKGFRCVLIDLPGHGSLMDLGFSKQTAVYRIKDIVKQLSLELQKTIYIGGSLGGYLGMQISQIAQLQFKGYIICMAGQKVGQGSSMKAFLGLKALKSLSGILNNKTLLQQMVKMAKSNPNIPSQQVDSIMRTGLYSCSSQDQCIFLQSTNPVVSLSKCDKPFLFINGSLDYRDSEVQFKNACKKAQLKVYEGGDHFFSHDSRYFTRLMIDIEEFCRKNLISE